MKSINQIIIQLTRIIVNSEEWQTVGRDVATKVAFTYIHNIKAVYQDGIPDQNMKFSRCIYA